MSPGSAPERKVFTEADDPKRLVEIDRDLHTATELYQDGKVQEAIALLDSVIARRPDTADAYISLAHAYWESGQPQLAIATLEQALANGAPGPRRAHPARHLPRREPHRHRAAPSSCSKACRPSDVEALNGLGVAYGDAGRYADAIQAFKRVLALDPTNGLAYQNLASMVLRQALAAKSASDRRARLQEAERYARQAIDADPSLPKAYTTLGVVLAESGRKTEAIDSWKRAVALDGREFDALYNLTSCCSRPSDWTMRARMRSSSSRPHRRRSTGQRSSRCGSSWEVRSCARSNVVYPGKSKRPVPDRKSDFASRTAGSLAGGHSQSVAAWK